VYTHLIKRAKRTIHGRLQEFCLEKAHEYCAFILKMQQHLHELRGLGAKSAAMLQQAGITTPAALHALGAVQAYVRLIKSGQPHNLNLLWALEGAITQRDWKEVARTERLRLLTQLDDLGHAPR
jgi:DNA transformation protein and related proteins